MFMQDLKNASAQKKGQRAPQAKYDIADFDSPKYNKTFKITRLGAADTASSKALDQGQNRGELFLRSKNNGYNLNFRGMLLL